jgi:hypothetical protein
MGKFVAGILVGAVGGATSVSLYATRGDKQVDLLQKVVNQQKCVEWGEHARSAHCKDDREFARLMAREACNANAR